MRHIWKIVNFKATSVSVVPTDNPPEHLQDGIVRVGMSLNGTADNGPCVYCGIEWALGRSGWTSWCPERRRDLDEVLDALGFAEFPPYGNNDRVWYESYGYLHLRYEYNERDHE